MAEKFKALVSARFGCKTSCTKTALRLFRCGDRDRDGGVSKAEFKKMLRGIQDSDIDEIYGEMDLNGNGTLQLDEIQRVLRADLPETRKEIIRKVFRAADRDLDGVITAADLRDVLNAKPRQDVIDDLKTEDEVFEEFLNDFEPDPARRDGQISEDELIDYYSKQSPYYFTDDSFRLFIQSQWHDEVSDAIAE